MELEVQSSLSDGTRILVQLQPESLNTSELLDYYNILLEGAVHLKNLVVIQRPYTYPDASSI